MTARAIYYVKYGIFSPSLISASIFGQISRDRGNFVLFLAKILEKMSPPVHFIRVFSAKLIRRAYENPPPPPDPQGRRPAAHKENPGPTPLPGINPSMALIVCSSQYLRFIRKFTRVCENAASRMESLNPPIFAHPRIFTYKLHIP